MILVIKNLRDSLHMSVVGAIYEVNLASQSLHLEVLLLSKFWSERGFQLIQILGLLGIYLNAAVVFVTNSTLLFRCGFFKVK